MQARNLDMRRQGNIINIAPRDELLAKDKAFLQAEKRDCRIGSAVFSNLPVEIQNVEEFRKICVWKNTTAIIPIPATLC